MGGKNKNGLMNLVDFFPGLYEVTLNSGYMF